MFFRHVILALFCNANQEEIMQIRVLLLCVLTAVLTAQQKSKPPAAPTVGSAAEYFPMQVGARWDYVVSTGPAKPLWHKFVGYSVADTNQFVSMTHRGKFVPALVAPAGSKFRLSLRVKSVATQMGPIKKGRGVEVAFDVDDLGVFEKNYNLFWHVVQDSPFAVMEVATYRSDRLRGPQDDMGMWRKTPGFSQRGAFFSGQQGMAVSFGRGSGESLVFMGEEAGRLRFLRIYEKLGSEGMDPELNQAFQEQMWFERGKGLVRLEQKIVSSSLAGSGIIVPDQKTGGTPSMTWSLVKFTPGK